MKKIILNQTNNEDIIELSMSANESDKISTSIIEIQICGLLTGQIIKLYRKKYPNDINSQWSPIGIPTQDPDYIIYQFIKDGVYSIGGYDRIGQIKFVLENSNSNNVYLYI